MITDRTYVTDQYDEWAATATPWDMWCHLTEVSVTVDPAIPSVTG